MNTLKGIDIICLGEVLIDMFPAEVGKGLTEVSSFRPVPGGAPANVAVAGSHLGLQTAFIGKVGEDAFGRHLADVLKNHHVDTRGMRFDKTARTGLAFIALPDADNYEILFYRNPGADMRLKSSELDFKMLQDTKSLHFGSLSLAQEPSKTATLQAIETVKQTNGLISFDVNYRPTLWESPHQFRECITPAISKAHVLKINEIELEILTGATEETMGLACEDLLKKGPQLVVVTLGPHGCYIRNQKGDVRLKGFFVTTVDATGCGDAFIAGLLSKLVTQEKHCDDLDMDDLKLFGSYANAVGALTAQSKGVIPALPFKEQVDIFIKRSIEKP